MKVLQMEWKDIENLETVECRKVDSQEALLLSLLINLN